MPTSAIGSSQPSTELAAQLRLSLSRLHRRMREQAQPHSLTPPQVSVVLRIERDGPATVSALARAEGVRPQSMRITVAALEAAQAVTSRPDPKDGRQALVDLTPGFRAAVRNNRTAKNDWLCRAIEAQLSGKQQDELAAALIMLQRLAEF